MKKRLLYFSHGLSANGIETFLVNVLKNIDKNKFDITVIIAIDEGVWCLHEQTVLDLGVKVIHAGDMDSVKKKFQYIKNIKKLLKNGNYDIVHSNMDLLNGITLHYAKKAGVPKRICHAHNSKSQYKPRGAFAVLKSTAQRLYYRFMKKLMINSSTDLLACSDVAGEYFYGDRKYTMVYNGVDLEKFRCPDNFDKSKILKELGLRENNNHIIVTAGRLSAQKNPLFSIEVISELKKLRTDFQYIWAGTGELEQDMKKKIEELKLTDTVIMAGLRTDIPDILNCCDCFLMTSVFEGLPFTLVEAQAAGLRCIVSDVVTKNADAGMIEYISLNKNASQWAKLIDSALDRPLPEIDSEQMKLFDIRHTVNQLEKIYNK